MIIQPLLATTVLFALPASALVHARRPSTVEWAWALLLVAGLFGFLYAARPAGGAAVPAEPRLELLLLVLTVIVAAALVGLGAGPARRHRAPLFGLATGIGYGAAAALIKYTTALVRHEPLRLITIWPLYALIILGAAALVLNQAGTLAAVSHR